MKKLNIIILIIIVAETYCQWEAVPGIEAGMVQFVFPEVGPTNRATANQTVNNQMVSPKMIAGFNNFQMAHTDVNFDMGVTSSVYQTYFILSVSWRSNLTISKWTVSYFAFDSSKIKALTTTTFYISQYPLIPEGGSKNTSVGTITSSITSIFHFLYFVQIWGTRAIDSFTSTIFLNTTSNIVYAILSVEAGSAVDIIRGHVLFINDNLFQTSHNAYIDLGHIKGTNGLLQSISLSSTYKTQNFAITFNSFTIQRKKNVSFSLSSQGMITLLNASYDFLNASYINARKHDCSFTGLFEITTNGSCVIQCPSVLFHIDILEKKCHPCNYTCLTCSNQTHCLTCNETNKRTFDNGNKTCPCNDGYYDEKQQQCQSCRSNCAICTNLSQCITCVSTTSFYNYFGVSYPVKYILTATKTCLMCSTVMTRCIQCTKYNKCEKCALVNFTLSDISDSCICNTGYFIKNSECILCKDLIIGCITCSSNSSCLKCDDSKNFVQSGGICICQQNYLLKNGICCHYSCDSCSTPDNCSSCGSTSKRSLTFDNKCPCNQMFYDNETSSCPSCMPVCSTCSSGTTCLTCPQPKNLTLVNNNCTCFTNYVWITLNCNLCSDIIWGCQSCNNKSSCKTCMTPNYTISSDTTKCQCSQQYFLSGTHCYHCSQMITGCVQCSSGIICSTCFTPNYTLANNICQCDSVNNFYVINNKCLHCIDFILGCQVCSSNLTCSMCFQTNYTMGIGNSTCDCTQTQQYFPLGHQCIFCRDILFGCIDCLTNNTCLKCDVNAFFVLKDDKCICIDGYYLNGVQCLKCQDSCLTCVGTDTYCLTCNNTALRFFDNNRCDCRIYFSDCRSSGNSECSNHSCHFLDTFQIQILSLIKDPQQNILTYSISINPILSQMQNIDLYSVFNMGLPQGTKIISSYSQGILTVQVQYYQNMQGNLTNITLNLNKTDFWYFQLSPQSIKTLNVAASNNLASNYYTQQIYHQKQLLELVVKITVGVGFIVFIFGLFSNKIVVTQMMGVMQISYIGLFILNHSDPLIHSLNLLEFTHGINNLIDTTQQNAPNRIYSTGYTSSLISNLNLMMVIVLIPPIASLIFYIIHRKSTKNRIKMQKACRQVLGQWLMTFILFILYNYSCSIVTVFAFSKTSQMQFILSIIELILITTVIVFVMWIFIKKDEIWNGQYKKQFNWNSFSQFYYIFPLAQRLLIGIMLTAGNATFVSAIISILIIITGIVIVAIKKPFIYRFQNIRSILVNIYGLLLLTLYIVLSASGPSKGKSVFTYFPIIIIGVVIINILTGLGFIIFHFKLNYQKRKNQSQCDVQQNIEAQMRMDMNRNVQKMIKEAKVNNLQNKLFKNTKKKSQREIDNKLNEPILQAKS